MPRHFVAPSLAISWLFLAFSWMSEAHAHSDVSVLDEGALCDGETDDSAAIAAAAALVPPGGRLIFPADATCALLSHVEIRDWDGVTIDGRSATIFARSDMPESTALMKLFSSINVRINDLNFDGNALAREVESGVDRDLIAGTGSNLMFYGADGLDLNNVSTIDAWHDNIYFDFDYSSSDPYVMDNVYVQDLYAEGAGRNNLTIINCSDCVFTDSVLAYAATANFDIEPYLEEHSVTDVLLEDSILMNAGASCVQVSQGNALAVARVAFRRNLFYGCNADERGMPGVGISMSLGEDITIEGNRFEDIDLFAGFVTASDSEACDPDTFSETDDACIRSDARSVIDFSDTHQAVVRGNVFTTISYDDPKNSSIFYFQNTPNQITHSVRSNWVSGVAPGGWCWVSDTADEYTKLEVQDSVTSTHLDGVEQYGCN